MRRQRAGPHSDAQRDAGHAREQQAQAPLHTQRRHSCMQQGSDGVSGNHFTALLLRRKYLLWLFTALLLRRKYLLWRLQTLLLRRKYLLWRCALAACY